MKKLLLLIPTVLIVSACSLSGSTNEKNIGPDNFFYEDSVVVYTDPETKVQYLIYDSIKQGGMTVRLNPDGTPMIKEEE